MSDPTNQSRRSLLARLTLGGALAYAAPMLTGIGTARASGASGGSGDNSGGTSRGDDNRRTDPPRHARGSLSQPAPPSPLPELVLLLPDTVPEAALIAAGYPVLQQHQMAGSRLYRLGLPPGRNPDQALVELAELFPGAPADRNTLYTPDEFLCEDGNCGAQEMVGWSGWPSAMAPRIGMIDTAINPDHEALVGQKLTVLTPDMGRRDAAGRQHGTAIAALLIGRIDSRTPGLLPLAHLYAVEAFHRSGRQDAADAYTLAGAIDHLVGAGVTVINMSFSGPENFVLQALVQRAAGAGIGLVAAAGNGGPGAAPVYPAAWPEVIAVTAVDAGLQPYRQANRGPYVTLAAPGVNLWTAASISGGRLRSGTSYAAPFVTAILAVERARAPGLPLEDHTARLIACARDLGDAGHDEVFGNGLVTAPGQCITTGHISADTEILPILSPLGE